MTSWKTYKIGDIGKIITGKTPKTAIAENYGGDIPFLTPSDDLSSKFAPQTIKTLTQRGLSEVKNCLLPTNAICVSCIGSDLGKVVKVTIPTVTNQQFNSVIPNEDFDPDFVYYLMTIVGKELNYLSKTSTAVPIVNKTQFSSFEFKAPPLEEQRRIAGILGAIDDKIENNRRINNNLEQQAQALFEEIFFSDNDWEYTTLGMLTEEVKTKVRGMDAKVLSPISSGELVLSEDYFTKQVYSQDISKYIVVEPKTFAYNPARVNIGSIGINSFDFIGCVSPVYVVFKTKSEYENFFRLFVQSNLFKEEVKSRAIGGVRQTLSYQDFAMITIKHPPIESIRTFNAQYNKLLDIINNNNKENETLATLRDTLLPKLMNGEIITR